MNKFLSFCFFAVSTIYSIVALWLSASGIHYYLHGWIGTVVFVALLFLRLDIVLSVFTFIGALSVHHFPWYFALLITAPGVLIFFFGGIVSTTGSLMTKIKAP